MEMLEIFSARASRYINNADKLGVKDQMMYGQAIAWGQKNAWQDFSICPFIFLKTIMNIYAKRRINPTKDG